MGKKNDSKSKAAEAAGSPKPAKKKAAKSSAKPVKSIPKKKSGALAISREEIALRAYFIAERRSRDGLPGDESQDWIEAERQLASERKRAAKAASLAP